MLSFGTAHRWQLPDYLQVWPAHGAGSACGKGLGAIPSSTVGYEKLFNPALQYDDEDAFVRYILADQPDAPKYFAVMKRVNKEGPRLLRELPVPGLRQPEAITSLAGQETVIDLSPSAQYEACHVPGTWNIPLSMLAGWAGWLVDYGRPVYLIGKGDQIAEGIRILHKIGVDEVAGYFDADAIETSGLASEHYKSVSPMEIADQIASGSVRLVDVRSNAEWNESFIPKAEHFFLGRLPENLNRLPQDRPVVAQCLGGARSAIAASILQAAGFDVINLTGGYNAWKRDGLATEKHARQDVVSAHN